jgi:DNA-binding MarR family transcriptional regulator
MTPRKPAARRTVTDRARSDLEAKAAAAVPGEPLATPQGCTNLKLKQASRLVARHYDAYLAPMGLPKTQYSLLSCVVKLGPLRCADLAQALQLDASTTTRNLQPLLARGLLQLSPAADARSRLVHATTEGQTLRAQAQQAWKQAQQALNLRLGHNRVLALHQLLDGCIDALAATGPHAREAPEA